MSKFFIPFDENFQLVDHQWDGYTLLLPCISVGNVPQLSTDLIINEFLKHPDSTSEQSSTKDLEFVGHILSQNVRPFAGPDPYKMHGTLLATSIQVFMSKTKKLVIIHQRSPIYKEYREDFYKEFSNWLSKHTFGFILVLSSSFDHFLAPEFIEQDNRSRIPIMYLSSKLDQNLKKFLEEDLNIKPMIKLDPDSMKPSPQGIVHIPGSGSARAYLNYLSSTNTQNILCLVMFCSEGDNRFHSYRFADKIADILNQISSSADVPKIERNSKLSKDKNDENELYQEQYAWQMPFSWRMMFGNEPPLELY